MSVNSSIRLSASSSDSLICPGVCINNCLLFGLRSAVGSARGLWGRGLSVELEIVFQARVEPFAAGQRHNLKLALAQPRAKYAQALLGVVPVTRLAGGHV